MGKDIKVCIRSDHRQVDGHTSELQRIVEEVVSEATLQHVAPVSSTCQQSHDACRYIDDDDSDDEDDDDDNDDDDNDSDDEDDDNV